MPLLPKRKGHTMHVTGNFTVKLTPQSPDNPDAQAAGAMRMSLTKQFSGALQGESHGEMLACGDGKTNGAYVVVEKFTGILDGREGGFFIAHHGLVRDGTPEHWLVNVVPGSGIGGLAGITGAMTIAIVDGMHTYALNYTLPTL
jgi:hypothetical protein